MSGLPALWFQLQEWQEWLDWQELAAWLSMQDAPQLATLAARRRGWLLLQAQGTPVERLHAAVRQSGPAVPELRPDR
jgi:hypothetical protein